MDTNERDARVQRALGELQEVFDEIGKQIVGQRGMVRGMAMGLLAGGHVLFEGVPGLAKTLAVKTLSRVLDLQFKRIQFTPDLLPADLIGNVIYVQHSGEFKARKGPVFANVVLADEINRAPAKVQSALLEAMEERQVTIGDETFVLDQPFFVLATQNPIEQEGTYPLPEAQIDRFLLKLKVGYPSHDEEVNIVRLVGTPKPVEVRKLLNAEGIQRLRLTASSIELDPRIEEYIVSLVTASRERDVDRAEYARYVEFGASPRASIFLYRCAKVMALFEGRSFVIPEDVKEVAPDVLRHRIVLTYEAESEDVTTEIIISELLQHVKVP